MSDFDIKDSGQRRTFSTGAQRDRGDLKPRPDLISPFAQDRVGMHMAKGAIKYQSRNWELGMPLSEFWASLFRHVVAYGQGKRDEDHLAAIIFNAQAMIHFEETKPDLDDMPRYIPEAQSAEEPAPAETKPYYPVSYPNPQSPNTPPPQPEQSAWERLTNDIRALLNKTRPA